LKEQSTSNASAGRSIAVTGAAGFIGTRVVGMLARQARHPLLALDIRPPGPAAMNDDVEFRLGGVAEPAVLDGIRARQPDVILHLASVTDSTIWDRDYMLERNVGEFDRVLEVAELLGARVVFASSAAVYGNGPVPMRETQDPQPHNPYALSKFMMEQHAEQARRRGVPVLALRFFNVYGPGEAHKQRSASMVFQIHHALTHGAPARVFRDGSQRRDFVHVDDVATAVLNAIDRDVVGVLNVGSGSPTTFNELVAVIADATGTRGRVEYLDEPTWEYQRETWASTQLAEQQLGFRAHPIVDGIRDFVAASEKAVPHGARHS
jgi:ADP-L-glycero-D-manno-heptose 6-epimerase